MRAGKKKSAAAAVKERTQAFAVPVRLEDANIRPNAGSSSEVLSQLAKGNRAFCEQIRSVAFGNATTQVKKFVEPSVKPSPKAIVLSCSTFDTPFDALFGVHPGELCTVRIFGLTSGRSDGVVGSIEYELSTDKPPVLLVLGNSGNEAVQAAVRSAIRASGRADAPPSKELDKYKDEDLILVQKLLPAARDALRRKPEVSFDELCEFAGKLNVWSTIEGLFQSREIYSDVASGRLTVQGAYCDVRTGRVHFLGEHPAQPSLLEKGEPLDVVRTASDPPVPPLEALCSLATGNRRYLKSVGREQGESYVLKALAGGGQLPAAVVLGCADSRAPVELYFDMQPGDLFVLRTAGNTIEGGYGGLLGSAEYAIAVLKSKLVVVTGHTMCGAVTAAVKAVLANESMPTENLGIVVNNIRAAAEKAIEQLPSAPLVEQVKLATKINILETMQKIMKHSKIMRDGLASEELMLVGAVYDIEEGSLEWIGPHPEQESLVGATLHLHRWREEPYVPKAMPSSSPKVRAVLDRLRQGNSRWLQKVFVENQDVDMGEGSITKIANRIRRAFGFANINAPSRADIILVGSSTMRVPYEQVFDSKPGEMLVQQCMGAIAGHAGGALFASLEFAVARFSPKVLVVVGHTGDEVVRAALQQVSGDKLPSKSLRHVLDQVVPSCMKAIRDAGSASVLETTGGRKLKVQRMATELNALYTIEQLLIHSSIIRDAVKNRGLELHAAVLDPTTGKLDFVGQHPLVKEILARD